MGRGLTRTLFLALVSPLLLCAVSAHAQTTALSFDSEPGDYIGQGMQRTWTPADLTFTAHALSPSFVQIAAVDIPAAWWHLAFRAPAGTPLVPGTYENAMRAPFANLGAGLDVSGSGRGCNRLVGRFVVYEIEIDAGGEVTRFAADFEQHCEDATPALFGAIRFNAARSSLVPFDGDYPVYALSITPAPHGYVTGPGIDCGAGRTDCGERYSRDSSLALTATPLPGYVFIGWAGLDCAGADSVIVRLSRRKACTPVFGVAPGETGPESPDYSAGAFYLDGAVATGEGERPPGTPRLRQAHVSPESRIVPWSVAAGGVEFFIEGPRSSRWDIAFGAPTGDPLVPGVYRYATNTTHPSVAAPVLRLSGGDWCSAGGWFVVYEFERTSEGLAAFAADFELPCGSSHALVSGSIRYNSTRSTLLPFDGAYPRYRLEVAPTLGGAVVGVGISCGEGASDCDETYGAPTAVALDAVAAPGYQFVGWSGSCSGAGPTLGIVVTRTIRCHAVFTPAAGSTGPLDPALRAGSLLIATPGSTSGPGVAIWFPPDASARVFEGYDHTLSFDFDSATAGYAGFAFRPAGGRVVPGDYDEAYSNGNALFPRLWLSTCSAERARVRVYEAAFTGEGHLLAFAADFEVLCAWGTPSYVVGSVRFNSARQTILPFDGAYPGYKLSIERAANGTVTAAGLDCGPGDRVDCAEEYDAATVVTLSATPSPGHTFVGWGGDCSGRATTTIAVDWIRRCYAIFDAVLTGSGVADPRVPAASFLVDSRPGDPIGQGMRRGWLDAVMASQSWSRDSVQVQVQQPDGRYWYVGFRAPVNQELRAGTYEDATSEYAHPYIGPGLSVSSPWGSCSTAGVMGRFVVHELAFASSTSGEVASFAADFEYRCSPSTPPLYGSIRFNAARTVLTPFPAPFTPVAPAPDVSGDGSPDFVWRHATTGGNAFWFMAGETLAATPMVDTVADLDWEIRAVGDMNGDGRQDMIWQHRATGRVAAWLFSGAVRLGTPMFSTLSGASVEPDLDWKIVGAADMNRDGHTDLLWRHGPSGGLRIWHMRGLEQWDSVDLPLVVPDALWEIAAVVDMNQDGWPDLVWRHYGRGGLATWLMQDSLVAATLWLTPAQVTDPLWRVVGAADIDGDGQADLVWQHRSEGRLAVWYMNGLELIRSAYFSPAVISDPNWRIVGVR